MDKQLLEMMGNLMEQMTEMKSELTSEIRELKSEMNTRFDAVDAKLTGVGEHFEELSKNTIQVQDEVKKELKYITHKLHALDRKVFMRTDSPQ